MQDSFAEKQVWYIALIEFIKDFIFSFFYIIYYAFIGMKACTYDLIVLLVNYLKWNEDKKNSHGQELDFNAYRKQKKD